LNALDLYSPKFGLDSLGHEGERITIKVVLSSDSESASLYGRYTIGSRHAQISAEFLGAFGTSVSVVSVGRYTLQDAVSEMNGLSHTYPWSFSLLCVGDDLYAEIESRRFPVLLRRMYSVGGRLYLLIQVLGKRLKIGLSSDGVRFYDSSNREIAGLAIVGNRLIVKRKFQHPELADKI
jgi:hypothetical protein